MCSLPLPADDELADAEQQLMFENYAVVDPDSGMGMDPEAMFCALLLGASSDEE